MATKNISYKVRCRSCGKEFIVGQAMSPLPQHPAESKKSDFKITLPPCPGSGHTGIPLETLHY